jgi:hypothetical protein
VFFDFPQVFIKTSNRFYPLKNNLFSGAEFIFSDFLKSFQVHPEVSNLYMAIMEDIFKTKEGDREKEIDCFQKNLTELETI